MTVKERLIHYINFKKLAINRFEKICGLSTGYVRNMRVSIQPDKLSVIAHNFPDLNTGWLITGEGEMLKTCQTPHPSTEEAVLTGKLIPFYDVETAAGTQYGMSMDAISQPIGLIEIGSVLRDSESAIRVYGNSMIPNYPAGCVIGLKLHTDSFIEPGRAYVIETRDNRYLKRLYYSNDKTSFLCLSDNQMKYEEGPRKGLLYYQDFEIPIEEVIRLHRVVGVIKRNIL